MRILTQRLKRFRRKRRHISLIRSRIYELKYEILNNAIKNREIDKNQIDLFHKYNRRLRLITFLQNG